MRALLEAVDLVLDVLGVRVDGRRDDLGEVVGEEIGRVEARVARPIPPALPVFGTTGKEAEATGTAAPNPCYVCSGYTTYDRDSYHVICVEATLRRKAKRPYAIV